MTYDALGPGALDYLPCRYGASKLMFRGPKRDLAHRYLAFLGGSETYGKFIKEPFPALVEKEIGEVCVNFGAMNAGVDVYMRDPALKDFASASEATVVQVLGAQNMTNRLYSVHPRRNDRFVAPASLLETIYREVDFSEFHFNRHMLGHLLMVSPERFEAVICELQQAWVARMKSLLGAISGRTVLLWIAMHQPPEAVAADQASMGADPLFVTKDMLSQIIPLVTEYVEVIASEDAIAEGTKGMYFGELEEPAAAEMPGPKLHFEAARALSKVLEKMI
ncbi:MAG: DUF6473 family protein [Pseudomonadota bacterium]